MLLEVVEFSGFASLLIWFGHCLCQFRAAGGQGRRAHWGCWACWSWSNFRGGDFLLFVSTGSPSVCLHKAGFPVCRPAQRPSLLLPPLLTPATAPRVLLSVPDPPSPSLSPCSLIAPSSFCRFWGVSALPPHPSSSSSSLGGIRVCLSLDFHHLCSIPNSLPLLQLGACVCLHSCAFLAAVPFSICPQRGAPVLCHCSACLTLPVGSGIVPCRVPVPPHAVIVPRLGETRSPIPAVPHSCPEVFSVQESKPCSPGSLRNSTGLLQPGDDARRGIFSSRACREHPPVFPCDAPWGNGGISVNLPKMESPSKEGAAQEQGREMSARGGSGTAHPAQGCHRA